MTFTQLSSSKFTDQKYTCEWAWQYFVSNSTEDYSFLNLESCDALPQEIHRFRFLFQKSA